MPPFGASDVPHTTQTDHRILRDPGTQGGTGKTTTPPKFDEIVIFGANTANLPIAARTRAKNIMRAQIAEGRNSRADARAARNALLPMLKAAPDDIEILDALARCSKVLNDKDAVIRYWNNALTHSPRHMRTLYNLALYSFEIRRDEQTLGYLHRFFEVNPWLADMYGRRSMVLARMGRLKEAIQDVKKASRLNPSEPRYYIGLAELNRRLGRDSENRRALLKANSLRQIRSTGTGRR